MGLFSTHSELNMEELQRIYQEITEKRPVDNLDIEAILSTYKGKSVFTM